MSQNKEIFNAIATNENKAIERYFSDCGDPDLTHPVGGQSLLQIACQANQVGVIELLLRQGADPNKKFTMFSRVGGHVIYENASALMSVKSRDAALKLIAAGAEVNDKDKNDWSALVWAVYFRRLDVVSCLIESGADLSVEFKFNGACCNLIELIEKKQKEINDQSDDGKNNLAFSMNNDYQIIKQLLSTKSGTPTN